MGFLTEIVAGVRQELAERPLDRAGLRAEAGAQPAPMPWNASLRSGSPSVIAEVKRASPSAGEIAASVDPAAQARTYRASGAAAISVLTERAHFRGSLDDLRAVRAAVDVPVLRKDFLVHPDQVLQARAAGADAVLVIVDAVDDAELTALLEAAAKEGLGVLLEAHGDRDLDRALATETAVVGVNARDLETLEVDLDRALERLGRIPPDRVAVLESGIVTRDHVRAAVTAGASAILVGEALMRASDPGAKLRQLMGREPQP
jgi:indole-3-glycerol phosphate synthase